MFKIFSRKKKDSIEPNKQKKDINAQEIFEQNLKYISNTSLDPEDIKRQFVKSGNRDFITVGAISVPTGKIIVSDPLEYLANGELSPELEITISPGNYPVEVSICRNDILGIRMCSARLKIKNSPATKYVLAQPTIETAVAKCADGVLFGFPVDAGMICFCDAEVAKEYKIFIKQWHKANPNKDHYKDYFAFHFLESSKAFPQYQREYGDFIHWNNPISNNSLVMVASGFGDGFYQSYWGYDSDNQICELVVPMVNPDLYD